MKSKILFILLLVFILFNNSYSDPRRVLIEFCTGTWCQYCPCADSILEKIILVQRPQTVVLAYHGNIVSGDPYAFFNGHNIDSLLGIWGYPVGVVDRAFGYPMNCDFWRDSCNYRYNHQPNTVINLSIASKNYNPPTRELTVTINSTAVQNLYSNYKINFVILENNLIYPQEGNPSTGCNGGANYIHYWVVRNMVNNAIGDSLKFGGWTQNQTISKTFVTVLDREWVAENCEFVFFVYRDSTPLNKCIIEQSLKQSVLTNGINNIGENATDYQLEQNYPNPFNPVTRIIYSIPKSQRITLKIYNVLGKEILTVFDGFTKSGTYNAEIDGTQLPSGVYFYTLMTEDFIQTKKMILLK